jgi:hypothetical protein
LRHHGLQVGMALAAVLFGTAWAAGQHKVLGALQQHGRGRGHATNNLQQAIVHKEVELDVADNVVVRRLYAPYQLDDKGKPRKPTPAELKDLKGPDAKAVGYNADLFDLKNGQTIQVSLLKRKDEKAPDKNAAKPANDDNVKPAAKKNADKADSEWVPAGTLTGTLTATPHSTKKNSNNKMTLRVDSVTTTHGHHNVHQGKNKTTLPDVKVSQIVILSKELPAKEGAAAKNN